MTTRRTPKERALADLARAQERLTEAAKYVNLRAANRDALALAAQETGATYAEMEEATSLSTARITQVLRRARKH